MEKRAVEPPDLILRSQSTVSSNVDDAEFESHSEDDDQPVYTPRSSHFGDGHPDLPPSYDESQAQHMEAQSWSPVPARDDRSDIQVYRTEIPPDRVPPPEKVLVEEVRPPSPLSGPSVLLSQALIFTDTPPATGDQFAKQLNRPVAIPSVPSKTTPVRFARFYARTLQSNSISSEQFMDFVDGLNALSTSCSASPAALRGIDSHFELKDDTPVTQDNLLAAYLAQTNRSFFRPRGLRVQLLSLTDLANRAKVPQDRATRASLFSDVLRAYRVGRDIPAAANGAATGAAQVLEPYVESLSFSVPEPQSHVKAINSIATQLAAMNLDAQPPIERSRSDGEAYAHRGANCGRRSSRGSGHSASSAGPSTLPLWTHWGNKMMQLGERQGKFWEKWGDEQGQKWGKWGEEQGQKWGKRGEEQGKRWASWGEELGRRFSEAAPSPSPSCGSGSAAGPSGTRNTAEGSSSAPAPAVPNTFPIAPLHPGMPSVPNRPPMPGTFPMAPGTHPAMMSQQACGFPCGGRGAPNPWEGRGWGGWGSPGGRCSAFPGPRGQHSWGPPSPVELREPTNDASVQEADNDGAESDTSDSSATSEGDKHPDEVFAEKTCEIERMAAEARQRGKKDAAQIERERETALFKAADELQKGTLQWSSRADKRARKRERRANKRQRKHDLHAWKKELKKDRRAAKREGGTACARDAARSACNAEPEARRAAWEQRRNIWADKRAAWESSRRDWESWCRGPSRSQGQGQGQAAAARPAPAAMQDRAVPGSWPAAGEQETGVEAGIELRDVEQERGLDDGRDELVWVVVSDLQSE